jgi:chromosome partitioning protein
MSSFVLVPLQAEPLALRSIGQVLRVIEHVQQQENPALRLLGILPTMVELRRDTSLNVMGTVWSELDGVLETVIPRAEAFARASELGLPVSFMGGRTPPEARRFELLVDEIERVIADLSGTTGEADEKVQRQLV